MIRSIHNPLWLVWRNFGSMAGAEVASRAIALVTVGFYARHLQPEGFGYVGYAMAVVSYPAILIALGFDAIGTREIASAPEEAGRYMGHILSIRLLVAAVLYAALGAGVWLSSLPILLKRVLWIEGLTLFPLALATSWVFQGLQKMHILALARVAQSLVFAGLVLWLVRGPQGVVLVSLSNVVSLTVTTMLMLIALCRGIAPSFLALDRDFTASLIRRSLPIALLSLCVQVYCQSGLVMLGWWRPAPEVGLYSSAYRLTFGLAQQFSSLLLVAFLPALSRAYVHAPQELRSVSRGYERMACFCAGGVLAVFALFPTPVLTLCFGASYAPAAPVLRLLAGAIAASFLGAPYFAVLIAMRFERQLIGLAAAAAAVCVLLNLLLVPRQGAEGAAVGLLVASLAMTLGGVYFYSRRIPVWNRASKATLWAPLARRSSLAEPTDI